MYILCIDHDCSINSTVIYFSFVLDTFKYLFCLTHHWQGSNYVYTSIKSQLPMILMSNHMYMPYIHNHTHNYHSIKSLMHITWYGYHNSRHTVLVQIFKGRIFCWCHKFSIFAILFSRITWFWHSIISMLRIINWGLNFRGLHVIRKNSEINVPRKFVRVRYIYVNSVKAKLYRIKTLTTS